MRYGLNEKVIKNICDVFAEFAAIEKAVLYGSRAQGTYRAGSDLDLTFFGQNLTDRILGDIADALDDLLLPYTFDLSIFDKLEHAKLRDHIKRVGVTFYQRPAPKKSSQNPEPDSGDAVVWEMKTLSDVAEIVSGGTPKSAVSEYWGGGVQWLTPRDMGKLINEHISETSRTISEAGLSKSSAKLVPLKSVILSTRAPIGHLAINEVPMAFNQGCRGLIPSNQLDTRYLFYFLKSSVDLLNDLGTGTTFKELSKKALADVKIPFPPLEEQKRIVAILDEAFRAIDQAIENTEKNLKNARDLFETTLNNIFTQNPEPDSGDAVVWETKPLGEVCKITGGGTPSKKNKAFYGGKIPWATVRDMRSDIIRKTEHTITEDAMKASSTNIIPADNVIIATRVGLGKVCFIEQETAINQDLRGIVPNNKQELIGSFLFWWLKSVSHLIIKEGTGATVQGVKLPFVKSLQIPLPPREEQKRIVAILDKLFEKKNNLEKVYQQKLIALKELKQSLLQKAFAGELTSVRRGVA